jgi:hypothetical protein
MSIADEVKINGHNLKGRKSILKPVNTDTMAMIIRKHDETIYIDIDMMFNGSINVTVIMSAPVKISATPSTIHSIEIMYLLS